MPKISVVIPVYNKAAYLKATIKSVLSQDFQDFELILINDGSTDHSMEIIHSFKDSRLKVIDQANEGVSKARNKGAQLAQASIIAFLDADDQWFKHHLSNIWQLQKKYPQAAFFATAYQIQYKQYKRTFALKIPEKDLLLSKFYHHDQGQALFFVSNFAIRKNIFLKENGFKTHIHAEDTEFFIRVSLKYPMAYSREVTMLHINAAENSLFAQYKLAKKKRLLDFFKEQARYDADLKRYLDIHRFAWSIEYKLKNKNLEAKQLAAEITPENLNLKQKILLRLPSGYLKLLKKIQLKLREKGLGLFVYNPLKS